MDGANFFSDVGRFGVLKDLMAADLKRPRPGVRPGGQEPHRAHFKRPNTVKPMMYKGASDFGQLAPIVENMTFALGPAAVRDFYL